MTPTNRAHTIAVIPSDGIGKEVVPEGLRVLEAAAGRFGFSLRFEHHAFASCDHHLQHGKICPTTGGRA